MCGYKDIQLLIYDYKYMNYDIGIYNLSYLMIIKAIEIIGVSLNSDNAVREEIEYLKTDK